MRGYIGIPSASPKKGLLNLVDHVRSFALPYIFPSNLYSGLVVWYDFGQQTMDGRAGQTIIDYSNYGNSGTLGASDASGSDDPAWTDKGLNFDGTNDYVNMPSNPWVGTLTQLSMVICFKRNYSAPKFESLISKNDIGTASSASIYFRDTSPYLRTLIGTNAITMNYDNEIDGSTVNIVSAGIKNNDSKMFLNGSLVASSSEAVPYLSTHNILTLGRDNTTTPRYYFNGEMYEILLYNRALSTDEHQILYNYLRRKMRSRGVPVA